MELEKIADVLDALADYVDSVEAEKTAKVTAEREAKIADIGEKYASATGEEIPDNILKGLINADVDVLSAIEKVASSKHNDTSLGAPGEPRDFSAEPETRKEAAEQAEDQFLNWIIS